MKIAKLPSNIFIVRFLVTRVSIWKENWKRFSDSVCCLGYANRKIMLLHGFWHMNPIRHSLKLCSNITSYSVWALNVDEVPANIYAASEPSLSSPITAHGIRLCNLGPLFHRSYYSLSSEIDKITQLTFKVAYSATCKSTYHVFYVLRRVTNEVQISQHIIVAVQTRNNCVRCILSRTLGLVCSVRFRLRFMIVIKCQMSATPYICCLLTVLRVHPICW